MSYYEFVWFLISEEDKRSFTRYSERRSETLATLFARRSSIEYWFRCMDLDGDGVLSMFELDYFYQEQVHKMEIYGIEYMPFEDCICQVGLDRAEARGSVLIGTAALSLSARCWI